MTVQERAILVSAPGKIILFAEHAVVYGKPAVAASLGLRTYLLAETAPRDPSHDDVELWLPELKFKRSWSAAVLRPLVTLANAGTPAYFEPPQAVSDDLLREVSTLTWQLGVEPNTRVAVNAFLVLYAYIASCGRAPLERLKICARSALPLGAGLGSSASYGVCLAAGILATALRDAVTELPPDAVNKWAFLAETVIHGTPSGIDNTVATFGGAMTFMKGSWARLEEFKLCRLLLTDTRVSRSTQEQVDLVRTKIQQFPKVFNPIMDAIEGVSEECQRLFSTPDAPRDEIEHTLETLIDINHHLIAAAGVSHPSLEKIRLVTAAHGLHSKLTGAGAGGCMLTLLRGDTSQSLVDRIKGELATEGFICVETSIGGPGFRLVDVTDMERGTNTQSEGGRQTWMDDFVGCDFASLEAAFVRSAK